MVNIRSKKRPNGLLKSRNCRQTILLLVIREAYPESGFLLGAGMTRSDKKTPPYPSTLLRTGMARLNDRLFTNDYRRCYLTAACAAANRAIGTRYGEQLT